MSAPAAPAPPARLWPLLHPALLAEAGRYAGHALLLCGPARVGKRQLALQLAALHNCLRAQIGQLPCEQCASCRALEVGAHPDLLHVSPRTTTASGKAARRRIIPVGAIVASRDEGRDYEQHVYQFLELRPTYRRRVVLIEGAEYLNEQAANALLKLVEEPPHAALFVFTAEDVGLVMPTIQSRCARLNVPPLSDERLLAALPDSPAVSPELLALAAGRAGVLLEREKVEAVLEDARLLTAALAEGLLAALEAAEALEKRFDPEWHPQALRFLWRTQVPGVRAASDTALERLLSALEVYANPALAFQVFALDLRAAFGES